MSEIFPLKIKEFKIFTSVMEKWGNFGSIREKSEKIKSEKILKMFLKGIKELF